MSTGWRRLAAGALAPLVVVGAGIVLAPASTAAVADGRAIEVFHGRNIVSVGGYPAGTPVKVEVLRGEEVIGFATYTTDADGFFEINHLGDGDCWQSRYTPNILPGDLVRTTVQGETTQDSTVTRDVFIDQDAEFLPGNVIRVTGHAKSTDAAPIAGDDMVELRMNKVSRTNGWETNEGRRDLRLEDVRPELRPDGTYAHDFVVSADDWNDAQTAGIDISTVWLHGVTETAEASELTFYDGEPEATVGCPPLMPDDRTPPTAPTGVQVIPVGTDGARVTWTAATDNVAVTGYTIYRDGVEVGATRVSATNPGTTYNDGPLPDGVHTYTVEANDATPNVGPRSEPGSVTVGAPGAPTGVTAKAAVGAVELSWTAPSNTGSAAITGYKVRVFDGATEVGTARAAAAAPVQVTGLTNGTPYTFRVAAVNSVGTGVYSAPSEPVAPTPDPEAPTAPTGLSAQVTNSSVALRWTAATDNVGVASYQVSRGTTVVAATVTGTTFTDTGVPVGTHGYTVRARDAAGNLGPASAGASATVVPPNDAPTVIARTPAMGAPGVAVGTNITATFSEAVAGVTTTSFAIRPTSAPTSAAIAGTVTRNGTTNEWILNPTANLAAGTQYTVTLIGGDTAIRDTGTPAAPLATTNWSFTTAAGDVMPPTVVRNPGPGGLAVTQSANITATFSEPVVGVGGSSFALRVAGGTTVVPASVTYDPATRVATLNPSANLAADTRYTATLTGGPTTIRDAAGNAFATASWTFLTGPRPTITARSPLSGATTASRTGNLTVTFSEAVNGVSGTTFVLRNSATNNLITAQVRRNGTTNQWILDPSVSTLGFRTNYTVAVTGGADAIRDAAGNPLTTSSWSFTTGTT